MKILLTVACEVMNPKSPANIEFKKNAINILNNNKNAVQFWAFQRELILILKENKITNHL